MNKNAAVSCYPGFVPYPSYRAKQMQKSHRRNVDDVSNTQRFNTYADNNPMRFTDPTGYDGFDDVYLGPGMQAWNGIKPEQDGPGGGSGGFNSPINFWVKLSEVNITAYSPVWDNWKNWYRKNNDPYLIWGKNAGANAGGMFGSISVSDTRRYWQNMSMRGGGFGGGGGLNWFSNNFRFDFSNSFGFKTTELYEYRSRIVNPLGVTTVRHFSNTSIGNGTINIIHNVLSGEIYSAFDYSFGLGSVSFDTKGFSISIGIRNNLEIGINQDGFMIGYSSKRNGVISGTDYSWRPSTLWYIMATSPYKIINPILVY